MVWLWVSLFILFVIVMIIILKGTNAVNACRKLFSKPIHRGVTSTVVYNENNGVNYKDPVSCNTSGNNWSNGKCNCNVGFFGPKCEEELLSDNYYNIGNVENDFSKAKSVDSLSFSGRSCSGLCDSTAGCEGFLYENNKCQLIGELVVGENNNLQYDHKKNGNLYYRKNLRPKFMDRGFLYYNDLPLRFWNDSENVKTIFNNQTVMLNFLPDRAVSDNPNGVFYFSNTKDFSKNVISKSGKENFPVSGLELKGVIYAKYVVKPEKEKELLFPEVKPVESKFTSEIKLNDLVCNSPVIVGLKSSTPKIVLEKALVEKSYNFHELKKMVKKFSRKFGFEYKELSGDTVRLERDTPFTELELIELSEIKNLDIVYKTEIIGKSKTYVAEKECPFTSEDYIKLKETYKGKDLYVLEITI